MATRAFVRQEVIDSLQVNPSDIRCPDCHGNNLILSGNAQFPMREVMEDGVITRQITDENDLGAFDISRLDCLACSKTFLIRDAELFRLEMENMNLRTQLGKPVVVSMGSSFLN